MRGTRKVQTRGEEHVGHPDTYRTHHDHEQYVLQLDTSSGPQVTYGTKEQQTRYREPKSYEGHGGNGGDSVLDGHGVGTQEQNRHEQGELCMMGRLRSSALVFRSGSFAGNGRLGRRTPKYMPQGLLALVICTLCASLTL